MKRLMWMGTLLVAMTGRARADLITPDEAACQGRVLNDACILSTGGAGTCQTEIRNVGPPDSGTTRTLLACMPGGTPNDSGGCAVAGRPDAFGALLIALGAVLAGRRRKERS